MSTTKTHWKKLTNPTYLGSWDFEENEKRVLQILAVKNETVKDRNGDEEEVVLVEFLKSKPMILNKTNLKAIEKATESAFIQDWVGKKITLFVSRIKAFGQECDALRIKPTKVIESKKQKLNNERFNNALEAISTGNFTIEELEKKYDLTEKQNEQLNKLL